MKISVALCTYNGQKYLREQLDSIAAQTLPPDELVVCDDRSTDRTPEILREFSESSKFPVRIFTNDENLGSSKNFEKAISLCEGDVIFLSDQDDIWSKEKLGKMAAQFEKGPNVGLVFTNARLADANLRPLGVRLWHFTFRRRDQKLFRSGKALDVLLKYNVVTGATMAFRSRFRPLVLPVKTATDLIHDGWISLMIAMVADIKFISEPLVTYRQHSGQQLGLILPKLNVAARERHDDFIENRKLGLKRLGELRELFQEDDIIQRLAKFTAGDPIDRETMLAKIDESIRQVTFSLQHLEFRRALPSAHARRILPIFMELVSGRYGKYSRGIQSAAVDLIRS
jgi:hypothetical protein